VLKERLEATGSLESFGFTGICISDDKQVQTLGANPIIAQITSFDYM
jgi:hypothetical protein